MIVKGYDFRGLYAITDQQLHAEDMLTPVLAAINGGARVVQYRDKTSPTAKREQQASALLESCRAHQVPLLINDDIALAKRVQADGVHIGRGDGSLRSARAVLGENAIIGVSCYDQPELAYQAQKEGADYVAFGRFYPSASKPEAVQAQPQLLEHARSRLRCPIVAIGGITAQNGRPLIDAGADMLAVIRGVFGANDVRRAAISVSGLFDSPE